MLEHVGGLGTVSGELSQTGGAVVDLLLQVPRPHVVHQLGVLCREGTNWAKHVISTGRMSYHVRSNGGSRGESLTTKLTCNLVLRIITFFLYLPWHQFSDLPWTALGSYQPTIQNRQIQHLYFLLVIFHYNLQNILFQVGLHFLPKFRITHLDRSVIKVLHYIFSFFQN